jgi:hypothetical protein
MAMPKLNRRRSPDVSEECWHVYYGDVHAGTIAIRSGVPHDQDPWGGRAVSIRAVSRASEQMAPLLLLI